MGRDAAGAAGSGAAAWARATGRARGAAGDLRTGRRCLGGPDCRTDADGCDTIRFSSFAPAADQAALDAWNAAGNGSQVALDGEWVSLSAEMPVTGNAQAVFANWNALLTQFVQTFDP